MSYAIEKNPTRVSGYTSPLFIISILFSLIFITITALQWILVEYLTPFLMAPLMLLLWGLLVVFIIGSAVFLAKNLKKNLIKSLLPIVINLMTFLVLWFVPFTSIALNIEFKLNYQEYVEVIDMVENGTIQPNEYGFAILPVGYKHISRGGDIIVDKSNGITSVFFYTFRGVLDNYSGFMYRSIDMPPDGIIESWYQISKQAPNWYFCSSK